MSHLSLTCRACGKPGAKPLDVYYRGAYVFTVDSCNECLTDAEVGLAILRGEFHQLLDAGVDRAMADRIMCERVARGEHPEPEWS